MTFDPLLGRTVIKIGPGEHCVSQDGKAAITTVLGSCVAACICDPEVGVGGMNHFMLPTSENGAWAVQPGSLRYGNFAMRRLLDDIIRSGGQRDRLEVKLFGGAHLGQDHGSVGARNARFALAFLADEGLEPVARHLHGDCARRVVYHPVTGRAFLKDLPATASLLRP